MNVKKHEVASQGLQLVISEGVPLNKTDICGLVRELVPSVA